MVECSGHFGYSKTVSTIARSGVFSIDAFPNPAKSVINVTIHSGAPNGNILLTDITGNILSRIPVKSSQQTINLNEFSPGIYFVKYSDEEHHQIIRIVKD